MVAEVFYKEITEHFKKATFLKMHTDGSGDLSFSDLKEYKLASGTFQDVAYIRYYEYLNKNIFNYLIDDAPKIESMTFSFLAFSKALLTLSLKLMKELYILTLASSIS